MNLYKRPKENQGILSTVKPREPILNIQNQQKQQLQTKLHQKKRIVIYVDNNKYYVEHSTAFALGIINTRAVMLDTPKLVEISYDIHNKLKNNNEIEIEYVVQKREKPKLRVFISSSSYYLENSAAYALGLLTVEEFNSVESKYYCIPEKFLIDLNQNYDVEMHSLYLYEEKNNRKV